MTRSASGNSEALVIGVDHVASLGRRDDADIILKRIGEDPAASLLIEPFELASPQREDASEHERGHAVGMRLGIGERERRPPRAAEHLPALDAEMLAQTLDVVDQIPGGVRLE